MSIPNILVTSSLPESAQRRLEVLADSDEICLVQHRGEKPISREELITESKGVDGILCLITEKVDQELLEAAGQQLKVISTMSVGHDHIDTKSALERGIKIGYTPDVLTDAVAEITVALALMAARRLGESVCLVKAGEWPKHTWKPSWLLGSQLTNKTVGFVGFGRIGLAVAQRMKAFCGNAPVLYYSRSEHPETANHLSPPAIYKSTLQGVLSSSDIIFICCALNDETRGMIDEKALRLMKSESILVNTSRGSIVVTDALIKALKEKWIAAAGLDVVDPEPIGEDHPLLQLSNCVVLPHIGSATSETREAMAHLAIDNLMAGVRGQSLKAAIL